MEQDPLNLADHGVRSRSSFTWPVTESCVWIWHFRLPYRAKRVQGYFILIVLNQTFNVAGWPVCEKHIILPLDAKESLWWPPWIQVSMLQVSQGSLFLEFHHWKIFLGTAAGISTCWEQFQRADLAWPQGGKGNVACLAMWRLKMYFYFPTPEGRHSLSHSGEMESEGEQP